MGRKIKINDERILIYQEKNEGFMYIKTIKEGFLANNEVLKSYSLFQSDDYVFEGSIDDNEVNELSFSFDVNHPLYFPLIHLLRGDESLIIDDDATRELNKKYLRISRKNDIVYLTFVNNLADDNRASYERFNVFIKNIMIDIRSKIDEQRLDTKERLRVFFNEVQQRLTEEYHQITIEEYNTKKRVYKMESDNFDHKKS